MKRLLVASILAAVFASSSANADSIDLYTSSEQLIGKYHQLSREPIPEGSALAPELLTSPSAIGKLASRCLREGDAFKRRDCDDELQSQLARFVPKHSAQLIAIPLQVYVEPYDFNDKLFHMCAGWTCATGAPIQRVERLGTRHYEFAFKELPPRINFSPTESEARAIEAVAASSQRRMHAILVLAPNGTEQTKTPSGAIDRRINASVVGIHLLKSFQRDPAKLSAPENIAYSISAR